MPPGRVACCPAPDSRPAGVRGRTHPARPPTRDRTEETYMAPATAILDSLRTQLDLTDFQKLHWEGNFTDYLGTVLDTPGVTRTAYQRLYDMILSHGIE